MSHLKKTLAFPLKYGLVETMRRIVRGRGYVPTRITGLYFRRLGGIGASKVVQLASASPNGNVEIILTHGWGGGADMYLEGRIAKTVEAGGIVLLVKPDWRGSEILHVDVFSHNGKNSFLVRSLSAFGRLREGSCAITVNELVLWHLYDKRRTVSVDVLQRLVDEILRLKAMLSARMTFLVHDYYCLCPRFDLVAPNGMYCASERTMTKCAECMNSCEWTHLQFEKGIDVARWRSCFVRLFSECNEVRTFSEDTKARIAACFPTVKPTVVPHVLTRKIDRKPKFGKDGIVIGVFGHVQPIKGSRIVVELAKYLERLGRSDVRIKIVGDICGVPQPLPSMMEVLGKYEVEDLPDIIEREGINIGFMSSICPETFSYVTHELMAMELPLVCFDIGAPRDAVAKYERGKVADEISAEAAWRAIKALATAEGLLTTKDLKKEDMLCKI